VHKGPGTGIPPPARRASSLNALHSTGSPFPRLWKCGSEGRMAGYAGGAQAAVRVRHAPFHRRHALLARDPPGPRRKSAGAIPSLPSWIWGMTLAGEDGLRRPARIRVSGGAARRSGFQARVGGSRPSGIPDWRVPTFTLPAQGGGSSQNSLPIQASPPVMGGRRPSPRATAFREFRGEDPRLQGTG